MVKQIDQQTVSSQSRESNAQRILEAQLLETIESYNSTVEQYYSNSLIWWSREAADRFCKGLSQSDHILDVGCGPGRDAAWFTTKGFKVVGLDRCTGMVEKACQVAPACKILVGDLRFIPLRSGLFDGAWCNGVLLHVPKQQVPNALSEIRRVLKEGALVCVSVKKGEGEFFLPDVRYDDIMKFWSFFDEPEIGRLAEEAGFRIDDLYSIRSPSGWKDDLTEWVILFGRAA